MRKVILVAVLLMPTMAFAANNTPADRLLATCQAAGAVAEAKLNTRQYQEIADYETRLASIKKNELYLKGKLDSAERENKKLWALVNKLTDGED